MYGITLHYTETEGIVGTVVATGKVDATELFDKVHRSWTDFDNLHGDMGELDDPIEDFVEYHNELSDVEITSICMDYIQL